MMTPEDTKLDGIQLIAKERQSQLHDHGRTIQEDTEWTEGTLEKATQAILDGDKEMWPWRDEESLQIYRHIVRKTYPERLAVAGAFIAAAIDVELYQGEDNDDT